MRTGVRNCPQVCGNRGQEAGRGPEHPGCFLCVRVNRLLEVALCPCHHLSPDKKTEIRPGAGILSSPGCLGAWGLRWLWRGRPPQQVGDTESQG